MTKSRCCSRAAADQRVYDLGAGAYMSGYLHFAGAKNGKGSCHRFWRGTPGCFRCAAVLLHDRPFRVTHCAPSARALSASAHGVLVVGCIQQCIITTHCTLPCSFALGQSSTASLRQCRFAGYKQELKRDFNLFTNTAISFSIISCISGVTSKLLAFNNYTLCVMSCVISAPQGFASSFGALSTLKACMI